MPIKSSTSRKHYRSLWLYVGTNDRSSVYVSSSSCSPALSQPGTWSTCRVQKLEVETSLCGYNISGCFASLSLILSSSFSCDRTLARSSLNPRISIALILTLLVNGGPVSQVGLPRAVMLLVQSTGFLLQWWWQYLYHKQYMSKQQKEKKWWKTRPKKVA